ncbi:alpha-2-macroglobulin family protein [Pseudodonghicola flavimaris]|uniref:Alpha-2-macroglobulin family protein n=1 Tax=Pseudodonghicola flavimaris TaxID=3050036 RepID=A0ABT7EZJ6_9RHOB|nr:alpha-2-macroglobulin family protein [Pseudodonghicola flavimaris]MDK3017771.1 alpha-2-macroglobulin family protein [Pseudodonghicola flavimaris]
MYPSLRAALALIFMFMIGGAALAQPADGPIPGFRYVGSSDTDFYGSDLQALFDTDLPSCLRACSASDRCTAFTFNTRSRACFPKSGVSERVPYQGALSAEKVTTSAQVLRQGAARAADLGFLTAEDMSAARDQARDLGLRHRAGGSDLKAVTEAARDRLSAGDTLGAANWIGLAVVLGDKAAAWTEYARLLLAVSTDNDNRRRDYDTRAGLAAINGYLRSGGDPARVAALSQLGEALERQGRGRVMLSALRLASEIQPRADILAALDEAIGKYGFRVTDSTVESDAAAPRICAQFSEPLARAGVDYAPFVKLPDPGLVVQVTDSQLCIDGVAHGTRYAVTFRKGLPAASGELLSKDVTVTHYVRDRKPAVRFPGRAYVLPKAADAALPVETVNVTGLDLTLYRISDRNLIAAMREELFARPLSHWQQQQLSEGMAVEIWSGSAEVQTRLNQDMTTRLPLAQAIAGQPAGIYALVAKVPGADPYDDPGATQWFVLSDLGLMTQSGIDGLGVQVLGLSDARPRNGIELTLISRANAVLGTAVTDADGLARFAPGLTRGQGAAAPGLLLARQGEADLAFLSLSDPAFDLSDRGVEGRMPAGPVDVFLTTDRGAYRAGEVIHVTALARDDRARAIDGLPLIAVLSRPDGVEYSRQISDGGVAGGHVFAFPVGASAPRGSWRLELRADPDAPALASRSLLVEDFLPERIDFDLSLPTGALHPGDSPPLRIEARYLFGAPGADLSIEGQVILRPADSVAGWPGYRFGRHDADSRPQSSFFGGARTDARGLADVAVEIPSPEAEGQPLEVEVIARLADGSARPVERRLTAPVRPVGAVIGIKPLFDDVVAEGTEAGFEVIGLSPDLQVAPMAVRWTLNRVETRYQWYQLYGNWDWEPVTRRSRIATGTADLGAAPLTISRPVDWGEYELVVERTDGTYAASSVDFYAGWYGGGDSTATPDRLDLSLDRDSYRVGDVAKLRIVPRMAGTALVTVMADRVISRQAVQVAAGESVIPLEVTADWGTGAYVEATVVRPMDVAAGQNPARAIGLAHAAIDPGEKALKVSIAAPELARPRGSQRIRVDVAGGTPGEPAWITLAAVDLGILNLTGFQSPDPQGYYFGQRRLGVELRDVYGRLIDGMNGALGTVRSGGDAGLGAQLQSPPPTQDLMAVYSGPVAVGEDGAAYVNVPLPDFNGTVRLMAVAWSRDAVGQAAFDMTVRDPVVVSASLPRFLAPGDEARVRLDITHADGPVGAASVALTARGGGLTLGAQPAAFTLTEGGKVLLEVPVSATAVGDPVIDLALTTPDGTVLDQSLRLPVRANDPEVAETRRFTLAGGKTFRFSDDVFAGLRPGTGTALLSAGPLARFDVPGLLATLDRYPYGCTEQVTSQAMPLLYLSSVAQAAGIGTGPAVAEKIDAAITRVLTRQAPNGAFGLWRAESGDFWLDAYVTDFLSRARAEGHDVADRPFAQALDNLRNRVNYAPDFDAGDSTGNDVAYALMVLAREGAAAMGDLRYYADVKAADFGTPLAAAQLGAALASYGDQIRADAMFARAARMIAEDRTPDRLWQADYGSPLRDTAAVLALATEAGSTAVDTGALIARVISASDRRSTQEAAWTLLAARALVRAPAESGLRVNGAAVSGPFVRLRQDDGSSGPDLAVTGADGSDTAITLTTLGVPEVAPEAGGTGYAITRRYVSMEGEPIEGRDFAVGDRFVAILEVTPFEDLGARLMISDPLPAGFEIDNPSLLRSGDIGALDWLKPDEATHAEFRSDRFLAAVDLREARKLTLAYVLRAVSLGAFHQPAASVEDMYRPAYRARTATGRIRVTE